MINGRSGSKAEMTPKCHCGQKEETELVTEETPADFSSVFRRSWLPRRKHRAQADTPMDKGKALLVV